MASTVQRFEETVRAKDRELAVRFSVVAALSVYEAIPREFHPTFLQRGYGEWAMQSRRYHAGHAFRFDDVQRMWRILQYLMTHAQPNRDPNFLATL